MTTDPGTLTLSPSEHHGYLMATRPPTLAYDGRDFGDWQRLLRRRVRDLIGEIPVEHGPPPVRTLRTIEHELGTIEKIVFRAEPAADVPAYVCLPANAEPPYPFVVCLQGHTSGMHHSIGRERANEDVPMEVAGDRDFALGCMRRGFAALCIEQRSFGERREQKQEQVSPHGCHDAVMHALMLGRTLAGERVFDVDRGIDYLATRPDADMQRIGVMGNSGGGTVTTFAAALLPRLAFAIPSCSFCTYRKSIMSIYHCADNYVPGLLKVAEMADVLGLFAPKPVVVVAGREDPIFPFDGVLEAFTALHRIYAAAGAPDNCRLVVGEGGHRFYADPAWEAVADLLPNNRPNPDETDGRQTE